MANRKSFQAKMNTRIAEVKTPGAASGAMTCRNAWKGVAPSTRAALSRSHGISRKKAESVHIASGSVKVMYGMISPGHVSNRCSERHMLNSGPMIDTGGNMAIASAPESTSVLPGKSSRTIAYAANIASTTASTVAISAMPIEFTSAALNWSSLKMFR